MSTQDQIIAILADQALLHRPISFWTIRSKILASTAWRWSRASLRSRKPLIFLFLLTPMTRRMVILTSRQWRQSSRLWTS
jgi:hypothetical protein